MRKTILWISGIALLANIALFFTNPVLRKLVDICLGRPFPVPNLSIGMGCQELLVYYDPWFTLILHVVFVVGVPLVPALLPARPDGMMGKRYPISLAVFCLFECLWLSQIFICLFCRGPHWNYYLPWEVQDPRRVQMWNYVDLCQWVWNWGLQTTLPSARRMPQNYKSGIRFYCVSLQGWG